MLEFDLLKAEQIKVRVSQVSEKTCSLLLYKYARIDMNMLDRHPDVGPDNWQCRYYECKGNLYCSVGIFTSKHFSENEEICEWVWKDDCGTESFTEKQKGEASDAFKRACFRWGIGRELYTAPQIRFWIADKQGNTLCNLKENNSKYSTYDKFSVEKIKYNCQRQITDIAIKNDTLNKRVFVYSTTGKDNK